MRVLVVTSGHPARWDGVSLVLVNQLRILRGRHEVRLFASGAPEGGGDTRLEGVATRSFGRDMPAALDYARCRILGLRSGEPTHVHWVERPGLRRAMVEELAANPPDLVHLHGWGTAQLWRAAGGVPTVHAALDAWGLGYSNRVMPGWRTVIDRGQRRRVESHERRHYPRSGAVVVVSEADAEYLRAHAPGARIAVIPNGVAAGPEPAAPVVQPVVGFHGALDTASNRDAALALARDVFPLIRARVPGARLLVVGRHPPAELAALAGDGVETSGSVDDVRPWLDRMAVYVAPMVSGTGIKNKVLEAMAAGLPVVATPAGLAGIGGGDGVVAASTPAELADRAVELLHDPSARREAGRLARRRVLERFTWEGNAGALEALWEDVSARRGPR
jgi:glycosyltransferase involved in cell wall biosynthesis